MKIEVKSGYDFGTDLSVTIYDECNHAGADIEDVEYAKESWYADAGRYALDDSEILQTLVCRCGYEEELEPDYDEE